MTDLATLRDQIDQADTKLIVALSERFAVVDQIKAYKKTQNLPPLDAGRYDQMMTDRKKLAAAHGVSPELISTIFAAIHDHSLQQQR